MHKPPSMQQTLLHTTVSPLLSKQGIPQAHPFSIVLLFLLVSYVKPTCNKNFVIENILTSEDASLWLYIYSCTGCLFMLFFLWNVIQFPIHHKFCAGLMKIEGNVVFYTLLTYIKNPIILADSCIKA